MKMKRKKGLLVTLTDVDGLKGYVGLKEITYTTTPFYYFSFYVEQNGIPYEVRSNYFSKESDIVNAEIDLSCMNGLHNIKARIDGQEV